MEAINEEQWPSADDPHEFVWQAIIMGGTVTVMRIPVLAPGEDWTGYPETWRMDRPEWEQRHEEYGLDINGRPLL